MFKPKEELINMRAILRLAFPCARMCVRASCARDAVKGDDADFWVALFTPAGVKID